MPRVCILRCGIDDGLADAVRAAGGEPVYLRLHEARPGMGVALSREWVADLAQVLCPPEHPDALLLSAERHDDMAGLVLAALRLDLPAVVVAGSRFSVTLAALGASPLEEEAAILAVRMARKGGPRLRELVSGFSLANALRAGCALGMGEETMVHLAAVAHEAGETGFARMIRVLAPETPAFAVREQESEAADFLACLSPNDVPTVEGRLGELLPERSADPAPMSRLTFVKGRASGVEAVCRAPTGMEEVAGKCQVFVSEDAAARAVAADSLQPESLIVVAGCGPRSGLRRLEGLGDALEESGIGETVSVLTDGLPPEKGKGVWISLFTPEAASGGIISLLEDGDTLRFDLRRSLILTTVSAEELESREPLAFPEPPGFGYAARYSVEALSAFEGAGFL